MSKPEYSNPYSSSLNDAEKPSVDEKSSADKQDSIIGGSDQFNHSTTFHVSHKGVLSSSLEITNENKTNLLYTIKRSSFSRPHVQVVSVANTDDQSDVIGSGSFHCWSSKIDMMIREKPVQWTKTGMFKSAFQYNSPAFGGRLIKWDKQGLLSSSRICYVDDDKNKIVAKIEFSNWALSKVGKIHILDPDCAMPGTPMFEELVVAAAIEIVNALQERDAAIAGASAAGAAGAAG